MSPGPGARTTAASRFEAPSPPRSPWQLLAGAVHRARRRWWSSRAGRLPRPVLSVGNLHWGGTGKTPLTAALGRHLRDRGLGVVVLSRGYGRATRGVMVGSLGDGPLAGPREIGDEPALLAEIPGVAVVVGERRLDAGREALAREARGELAANVFVLDDGFSHLRLARDLDLLALPAADPFGGGRLPPGGRLREPLASSGRADALVVTGRPGPDDGERAAAALALFGFAGSGFVAPTVAGAPRRADGGSEDEAPRRVLAVAGIARPERFFASARAIARASARAPEDTDAGCWRLADTLAFPDHHRFPPASLDTIEAAARSADADAVLVTTKDRVKLADRSGDRRPLALPLWELPVEAAPEERFWTWLDGRLEELLERTLP